jgi:hypothetical protein
MQDASWAQLVACFCWFISRQRVPTKRRARFELHGLTPLMTLLFTYSAFRTSIPANGIGYIRNTGSTILISLRYHWLLCHKLHNYISRYFTSIPTKQKGRKNKTLKAEALKINRNFSIVLFLDWVRKTVISTGTQLGRKDRSLVVFVFS